MPEIFNIILVSMSRLLFSTPSFVKLAERSLLGARQVQDSSGEFFSGPVTGESSTFRGVLVVSDKAYESAAIVTSLSSCNAEPPGLGDLGRPTFYEQSGDILSSRSATGGVINSPIIASNPYFPPINSDDDIILSPNSFSHASLVSDNSVDDEYNDCGSLDTLPSSASCSTVTGTLHSSKFLPRSSYGLGISGLTRKDGSEPFDGLGIVSIKSSAWRHDLPQSEILQFEDGIDQSDSIQGFNQQSPSSSTYDSSLDSDDFGSTGDTGISDEFLQQTLLSFTQDPYHQLCNSIPDCDNQSWSELGLCLAGESGSTKTSMSELLANDNSHSSTDNDSRPSMMMMNYRRRRVPKLNTNFSSATISSELKRSSTIVVPKIKMRHRSSSWPTSNMDGTVAAMPLSICKWRL